MTDPFPEKTTRWLVFTDLDGTLLDHHDYSYAAARPALDLLQQQNIPVILNSSKTPAELASLAHKLALNAPLIAENGSIILFPDQQIKYLGTPYTQICSVLDALRTEFNYQFAGFHDWDAQQIAEITGLSLSVAEHAGQRQSSEPLLWQDEMKRLDDFRAKLAQKGLTLKRGGRFWHVMGQADKVDAMRYLISDYEQAWGVRPKVIALGDGPNDCDMLAAADVAVVVNNPDGTPFALPERATQQVIRTTLTGPAGWNAAIQTLLNDEHQ